MRVKNYEIESGIKLLDKDYIVAGVKRSKFNLDLFESLKSTNEYLKEKEAEKIPRFCLAEQQTQGKGTLGKNWYSPFGQNIYLSCQYLFQKDQSSLLGLSLVVAEVVANICKKYLPSEQVKTRWPNDILFDGKKLSGILIETQSEAGGSSSSIIGVGLNVNMVIDKDKQISDAWTSMRKIKGSDFDRNGICVELIEALLECLDRFSIAGL